MDAHDVPAWCRWRSGSRPLLLIAPHGGRADFSGTRAAKVNDVHTADLTWELATRLDASAIVNPTLDRNQLDLNRISQVLRDATWFPALIEHLLAPLLAAHARVEVWFIHGWNVIQPKCDIGIGARFTSEADATALTELTVSARYVTERLRDLRARCSAAGVHTAYGERYPASHRNNVIQLFRRDGSRPCPAAAHIATWAAAGRLDAVQLELGVPLRWPGRLRERFTAALAGAFTDRTQPIRRAERRDAAHANETAISPVRPTMLLAYDPRAALGFMAGINAQPNGHLGARLLVFSQGQTMALFTGEDPSCRQTVIGGPEFSTRNGITELTFRGSLLEVEDAAAYVSLEQAFLQSRLISAEMSLSFIATHSASYGRVEGALHLDGVTHRVDTFGFRDIPIFLRRPGLASTRCAVAAAFGADRGIHVATADNETMTWTAHAAGETQIIHTPNAVAEIRTPIAVRPSNLLLRDGNRSLNVQPLNYMLIHRPLADGRAEMIFLGLAQCALNEDTTGYGFYEYVRPSE